MGIMLRIFILAGFLSVGDMAMAASFDCGKARTAVEKALCNLSSTQKSDVSSDPLNDFMFSGRGQENFSYEQNSHVAARMAKKETEYHATHEVQHSLKIMTTFRDKLLTLGKVIYASDMDQTTSNQRRLSHKEKVHYEKICYGSSLMMMTETSYPAVCLSKSKLRMGSSMRWMEKPLEALEIPAPADVEVDGKTFNMIAADVYDEYDSADTSDVQALWMAAWNSCFMVSGSRPTLTASGKASPDSGVSKDDFAECQNRRSAVTYQCMNLLANMTRPTCKVSKEGKNKDYFVACMAGIHACDAVGDSRLPAELYNNKCQQGLSLYQTMYANYYACQSDHLPQQKCLYLKQELDNKITIDRQAFEKAMADLKEIKGCWTKVSTSADKKASSQST